MSKGKQRYPGHERRKGERRKKWDRRDMHRFEPDRQPRRSRMERRKYKLNIWKLDEDFREDY
jgi:hypothetical protein